MSNKFDKKINRKLNQTEIAPSAGLWDKIEAQLDEKDRKKGILWLPIFGSPWAKSAIAASVMFLLGGLSTYYFMGSDTPKSVATNNEKTNILKNKQPESTSVKNIAKTEKLYLESALNSESNKEEKPSITATSKVVNKNSYKQNTNNLNLQPKTKNIYQNKPSNAQVNNILFSNTTLSKNTNQEFGSRPSDYEWIYDESIGAYNVVPKSTTSKNNTYTSTDNSIFLASEKIKAKESETSFMSIIEEKKQEKPEILEETEDEPVLKPFNTKSNRISYQGFWLGPQVGFEGIFVANNFYPGGSFGVDVGYDFANSWGLQTGLKYAINSKTIPIEQDGNSINYKSEFNSLHLPIYARYKFTKLTQAYKRPLSLNLIGGVDYAYVNQKKLHQLGLNLGAEYDIFTQADLMFTLGVKGGVYNNLNLYKIDMPEKINRYNYLLNAYLSVRFIDWVKKK